MSSERLEELIRFYLILDQIEKNIGGARTLADCSGRMDWPKRGVYFFREPGESRTDSGTGPRIVRVGTHALTKEPGTKLWTRLRQHKGSASTGAGDHRGSIFRLIVGTALSSLHSYDYPTWGDKAFARAAIKQSERALECEVSTVIANMPFLWLSIGDAASPGSLRGYIERNSIALLSNYERPPLDLPSPTWLGLHCNREKVVNSGLWNSNHVDKSYDPAFLDELGRIASAAGRAA